MQCSLDAKLCKLAQGQLSLVAKQANIKAADSVETALAVSYGRRMCSNGCGVERELNSKLLRTHRNSVDTRQRVTSCTLITAS